MIETLPRRSEADTEWFVQQRFGLFIHWGLYSIPARHDVWRRVVSDWLARLLTTGVIDDEEASEMARELAYGLAKRAYRLENEPARSTG